MQYHPNTFITGMYNYIVCFVFWATQFNLALHPLVMHICCIASLTYILLLPLAQGSGTYVLYGVMVESDESPFRLFPRALDAWAVV